MQKVNEFTSANLWNALINQNTWGGVMVNVKAYGAKGDGETDDTAALANAYDVLAKNGGGMLYKSLGDNFKTSGQVGENNNISPVSIHSNTGAGLTLQQGTKATPSNYDNDPLLWVQKFTKHDTDGDPFAHNIGGAFFEVYAKGSGVSGSNDIENTWIGLAANTVQDGKNLGTPTAQDWDAAGSVIGIAGFARANGYPGTGKIITALWGYSSTPELNDTTFDNLPSGQNFSTIGWEINLDIRHKDVGKRDVVAGHGSSVGGYLFNYRDPGRGVMDWTFGIALNGNPNDDDYLSTNVDNWNGFWTGILIDKIKGRGIKFGQYFKTGSYGIEFPTSFAGTQEPLAGIFMGNTKLNMGSYTGATFNNGDVWQNAGLGWHTLFFRSENTNWQVLTTQGLRNNKLNMGGFSGSTFVNADLWAVNGPAPADTNNLKYRRAGVNESMFGSRGITASASFTQSHRTTVRIDGNEYAIPLQLLNGV